MRAVLALVITWLLFCCPTAAAQGDFETPEGSGLLVSGDFNADGYDDLLLIGRTLTGDSRTFFGQPTAPHFTLGPTRNDPSWWNIIDAPVFVGGFLYIPKVVYKRGNSFIEVFRYHGGNWQLHSTLAIYSKSTLSVVGSIKITPAGKDLDGDKKEDVFVAWSEVPLAVNSTFYVAYATPSGMMQETPMAPINGQGHLAEVADIHQGQSFDRSTKSEEFIVILSGLHNFARSGFGIISLSRDLQGSDLKVGAGLWANGMPTTPWSGLLPHLASSCYGKFGFMPDIGTPLVQVVPGPGIIFMPWVEAPYVSNEGEILGSTAKSKYLAECTGDYDGDGLDEVVLVDSYVGADPRWVFIGDPTTSRTWAQAFDVRQGMPRFYGNFEIYHGTKGDFNGDGKLDMVISYASGTRGLLALYLGDPKSGPGEPPLRHVK